MTSFLNPVISWREPLWYSYRHTARRFIQLVLLLAILYLTGWIKYPPLYVVIVIWATGVLMIFVPLIQKRWPTIFPECGNPVTLFDDRITCVSAKAPINIALDNIDECLICTKRNRSATYTILTFKPKKKNLAMSLFGVLTETAISDPLVVEKVVENLKGKGIPVVILGKNIHE